MTKRASRVLPVMEIRAHKLKIANKIARTLGAVKD